VLGELWGKDEFIDRTIKDILLKKKRKSGLGIAVE